jgi:hypothetical protein
LFHLHEPHQFKVLFDETSHAAGAFCMHQYKQAGMPEYSHYVGDVFAAGGMYPAFRQYFFQLLVSLLHDLSGYRVQNVFILNGLLGAALLLITYRAGFLWGGRVVGLVATALLATMPLLAQIVTSGSYDLLNLVLLALMICISAELMRGSDLPRATLIEWGTLTTVLLALTRAESILYVLPWAGVVAFVYARGDSVRLTWVTSIAPVFLLPNLVTNYIMLLHPEALDKHILAGKAAYFSSEYLPNHLSETVYYLFAPNQAALGSVLVASLGALGLLLLFVQAAKSFRTGAHMDQLLAWFSAAIIGMYMLTLCQHWSSPISAEATRFSLPLWWVFSVVAARFLGQIAWAQSRVGWILGGIGLWYLATTIPASTQAITTNSLITSRAEICMEEEAAKFSAPETLFVCPSPVGLIAQRHAAMGKDMLNERPSVATRALRAGFYKQVILFELQELDPTTGAWKASNDGGLSPSIQSDQISERRIGLAYRVRALRFRGHLEEGRLITPESDAASVHVKTGFKNADAMQQYLLTIYPR